MRILLLLCLFKFSNLFGQLDIQKNSFAKYSYNLIGYTVEKGNVIPYYGSCFFIRNKDRLFLISANHVLCGCLDNNEKANPFPQILNLVIHTPNNEIDTLIPINFKPFQDTCKCVENHISPDIGIIELSPPKSFTKPIYSVENFLQPLFKDIGELLMYGYPGNNQKNHPSGNGLMKSSLFTIPENKLKIFTHSGYKNNIDSFHYIVRGGDADTTLKGYSGSPVFLQNPKTKAWRLLGVFCFFGVDDSKNKFIGIGKIESVLNRINSE